MVKANVGAYLIGDGATSVGFVAREDKREPMVTGVKQFRG